MRILTRLSLERDSKNTLLLFIVIYDNMKTQREGLASLLDSRERFAHNLMRFLRERWCILPLLRRRKDGRNKDKKARPNSAQLPKNQCRRRRRRSTREYR
jgi:hypothetical protein